MNRLHLSAVSLAIVELGIRMVCELVEFVGKKLSLFVVVVVVVFLAQGSMRTLEEEFCGPTRGGIRLNHDPVSVRTDLSNVFRGFNPLSRRDNFMDLPAHSNDLQAFNNFSPNSGGDSPEESDDSDALLRYISHILMEEDLEGKTCMFQDALALQAFEKSLYDALGEKHPPSPLKPPPTLDQQVTISDNNNHNNNDITSCGSTDSMKGHTTVINLDDSNWVHAGSSFLSGSQSDSCSPNSVCDTVDGNRLVIDLDNDISIPPAPDEGALEAVKMAGNVGTHCSSNGSRGRKNHEREENDYLEEERRNKHSATYSDENELSYLFDKVLLCKDVPLESAFSNTDEASSQDEASKKVQLSEKPRGRKSRSKKGKKQGSRREMVDLTTLLTHCAQAVASNDQRTAREQLKQIRLHSSPFGDASQRLAHCFASALEGRLGDTGKQMYSGYRGLAAKRRPASDILKAYHVFISTCPFKKMSNMLANRTIMNLAEKATSLHIIDFGVLYGFQWPCLIQRLSKRSGGPPKLRITGIELPQSGFRPTEWVKETGRRLADYCKRFKVPFEYSAIAQKWETIQLEDFKIDKDELLVVNCLYRLRNLLDETVIANSPRDSVLNLIKRINPDIFIHGVVNGNYNAPFFVTRFREALFHFSALFDMFEAVIPREDESRMLYETEIFGGDAMNVIACEGSERLERPETYKQWQVRNMRAGFKQLPLNQEILKEIRSKVKSEYHKDFVVDENSHWMLQGWKGRILYALSCWQPT